jgi:hypothetical protein
MNNCIYFEFFFENNSMLKKYKIISSFDDYIENDVNFYYLYKKIIGNKLYYDSNYDNAYLDLYLILNNIVRCNRSLPIRYSNILITWDYLSYLDMKQLNKFYKFLLYDKNYKHDNNLYHSHTRNRDGKLVIWFSEDYYYTNKILKNYLLKYAKLLIYNKPKYFIYLMYKKEHIIYLFNKLKIKDITTHPLKLKIYKYFLKKKNMSPEILEFFFKHDILDYKELIISKTKYIINIYYCYNTLILWFTNQDIKYILKNYNYTFYKFILIYILDIIIYINIPQDKYYPKKYHPTKRNIQRFIKQVKNIIFSMHSQFYCSDLFIEFYNILYYIKYNKFINNYELKKIIFSEIINTMIHSTQTNKSLFDITELIVAFENVFLINSIRFIWIILVINYFGIPK